jgi:DtxR family Mn-dependent transcriptional regulator
LPDLQEYHINYYKVDLKLGLRRKAVTERLVSGESAEMYLKAICELTAIEPLVPISTLADRLGISVVSATEMVHRMRTQGLLEHKRYKGVRLTKEGRREALDIVRSHRLWERFLVDHLKLPWEDSHDLACQLEHAASPEVVEALSEYLGQPSHCPHGNPIPTSGGTINAQTGIPLDNFDIGKCGIVMLIHPETNAALSYFASHGIKPGVRISVKSIDLFDQLWTLEVAGKEAVISKSMVSRVYVQLVDESAESRINAKGHS